MEIRRIPIDRLRAILADTERVAGADSQSAQLIRRELLRREQESPANQPRTEVKNGR